MNFKCKGIPALKLTSFFLMLCLCLVLPAQAKSSSAQFDQETVEELALFIAEESMRRIYIPITLRILSIGHDNPTRQEMIDKISADPPRADAKGNVYPFKKNNNMSFVYHAETGEMLVHESMIETKGKMPRWGLTAPELADALNAASSKRQRGGTDFVYDPYRDALSFQLRYANPPKDRERFYQDIHKLKKTALKWSGDKFSNTVKGIAEKRKPPDTAIASSDGFEAALILRHFHADADQSQWALNRFFARWDRPKRHIAPRLVTDQELRPGSKMYSFISFMGATEMADGKNQISASFRLRGPDGSILLANQPPAIWNAPARDADRRQLAMNDISFRIENEPAGRYQFEADICDMPSERCVKLVHPFELLAPEKE